MKSATFFPFAKKRSTSLPRVLGLDDILCLSKVGQSNQAGKTTGTAPSPYNGPIHGTLMRSTGSNFSTLNFPTNVKAVDMGSFGSELSYAKKLWDEYKRPMLMDKVAIEGAAMFDDSPNPNFHVGSSASLYPQVRDGILAMKAEAAALGKNPVVVLDLVQGERDTTSSTVALAYFSNVTDFLDQLAIDGAAPDYVIINLLNRNQTAAGTPTTRQQVRTCQENLVAVDTDSRFAIDMEPFTAYLQGDVLHYNNTGQVAIGNVLGDIVIDDIFTGGQEVVTGFSAEATLAIQQFNTSVPSGYKTAIATAIDSLVTAGLYSLMGCIQVPAMNSSFNGLQDLLGKVPASNHGCTHTAKRGFRGNFSTLYVNHRYDASIDGQGIQSQNDNGGGLYIKQNYNTAAAAAIGLTGSGGVRRGLVQANTQINYYCNSTLGGSHTPEDFFANESLYCFIRNAASGAGSIKLIKNGVVLNNGNNTSLALPSGGMFGNGNNNSGALASPADLEESIYIEFKEIGMNHTTLNTIMHQLMTDLAAL